MGWDTSDSVGIQALTAVKIQLYQSGTLVQTITDSADNSGSYSWTVPASLGEGGDYRIKVSCRDDPGISDESDQFRITLGYGFISSWGGYGEANGYFKEPEGIAVSGYVYVSDTMNFRIQKFTSDGIFVDAWGSRGEGDGEFDHIRGLAVDGSGNVYVTDSNGKIQKFSSNGTFLLSMTGEGYVPGQTLFSKLAVDESGYIYATDVKYNRVQKFSPAGVFVQAWGSGGSGDGQFNEPNGIAVGNDGYIYVADTFNRRIQRFTKEGVFVSKWGTHGSGEGELEDPRCLAVDSAGNLFVGDSHRIQRFTPDGVFLTGWGDWGDADGEFDQIRGAAVDESGNVYTIEYNNNRVQKFGPNSGGTMSLKPKGSPSVRTSKNRMPGA
jgi:sugar lactone lactonase YvrE